MKEFDAALSELEFERLPPTLRRKYFSSLERLRLAQDGAYPIYPSRFPRETQHPPTSSNASSFSARRSTRRPSTTLDDCLHHFSSSTRNKLRKHSRLAAVSPQLVAHFASLPPTLQRKYFSREEQVLLASRINHIILDAADEVLYKQYGRKSRPSTAHVELTSTTSDFDTDHEDEDEDMELSPEDMESLRWLDEEESLDLSLYDYHAAVVETSNKGHTSTHRSSFRRGLSLANVQFSRRSSSTNSIAAQPGWPLPNTTSLPLVNKPHRAPHTGPTNGHRRNRASTSSLDPSATHYQDPAARMKLRVYLASPQKFDEAIEFGFPSMQDSQSVRPVPTITNARSIDSDTQLTPRNDTPSLTDGEGHEFEDLDSPRTPEMSAFSSASSKSKDSSLDRTSVKPKIIRDFTDPYVHALASNREMTLHMTLTRPDLRSPDELSSTRDINSRPLEQAPLHFSDDAAGFWDSLPDEESKMRKLFRKLKLRQ